jgi:hypothetical protein
VEETPETCRAFVKIKINKSRKVDLAGCNLEL